MSFGDGNLHVEVEKLRMALADAEETISMQSDRLATQELESNERIRALQRLVSGYKALAADLLVCAGNPGCKNCKFFGKNDGCLAEVYVRAKEMGLWE